jgi:hypothetical protein
MGWMIGVWGFDSRWVLGILLFCTASILALRPTHPPIQWVPGALSPGVKWLRCEADHSPPSAEVKYVWCYTPPPTRCQLYLLFFLLIFWRVSGVSTHFGWCLFLSTVVPISCWFLYTCKIYNFLGKSESIYCWANFWTHLSHVFLLIKRSPRLDTNMKNARIWLTITDDYGNELHTYDRIAMAGCQ